MGSQTLEILRQGVWASLTGGWFYDPHQNVFCNAVHLYLWLFLLCTPFITYLYFPKTLSTWGAYCIATTLTIAVLKIINMALHLLYDKAQALSESNLKNPFKGSKEVGGDEDCGIEMQVLNGDIISRSSVDHVINETCEANSIISMDNVNSTIDLKVDVHRKNSSESCDSISYYPSCIFSNISRTDSVIQGGTSVECGIVAGPSNKYALQMQSKSEENTKYCTEFNQEHETKPHPKLERKFDQVRKRRVRSAGLGRQGSLDSAADPKVRTNQLIVTPCDRIRDVQNLSGRKVDISYHRAPGLLRYPSTETHEERQKRNQNLFLPIHHEHQSINDCINENGRRENLRGNLQSWMLGSSDMYLEVDSYTKSDMGIEKIDKTLPNSSKNYHLHQHTPMRKDSNSTMSALHLPVIYNTPSTKQKKRRHSNTASISKSFLNSCSTSAAQHSSNSHVSNVRRIKSAALEISCPQTSVSNLKPHPNSVEAISGKQIKNCQSAMLPPPSKCLVRNPHLNLCPKFCSASSGFGNSNNAIAENSIEPVYPIVEQADERSLSEMFAETTSCGMHSNFANFDYDQDDEHNGDDDDGEVDDNGDNGAIDVDININEDDDGGGARAVIPLQQQRLSTTESESEIDRARTHSTDSETDNNGSRSPLLNKVRHFDKIKCADFASSNKNPQGKAPLPANNMIKQPCPGVAGGCGDSGCPSSDCDQVSASSKDMLLSKDAMPEKSHNKSCETVESSKMLDADCSVDNILSNNHIKSVKSLGAIPKVLKRRDTNESQEHETAITPQKTHSQSTSSSPSSSRSFSTESFSNDIYKTYKDHWVTYDGTRPIPNSVNQMNQSIINHEQIQHLNQPIQNMPTYPISHHINEMIFGNSRRNCPDTSRGSNNIYRMHQKLPTKMIPICCENHNIDSNKQEEPSDNIELRNDDITSSSSISIGCITGINNSSNLPFSTILNGGYSYDTSLMSENLRIRTPGIGNNNGSVGVGGILNVSGHVEMSDYWRPSATFPDDKPTKIKRYYKYRLNFCCAKREIKIGMDRLQLMALFDRDLNWFHVILAIILSSTVCLLGSTTLQLGFYKDIYAFIFCIVIAGSQYSLLKSVQPDAASPIHGFNKTVAYSRPIYFCICSGLLILFDNLRRDYELSGIESAKTEMAFFGMHFDVVHFFSILSYLLSTLLLMFPVLFSLGLFPQINTFAMYSLEQIDMHFFGGNASISLTGSILCVIRSIMAVLILYGPIYCGLQEIKGTQHISFSIFCALLVPLSYHLSRSASDFTHLWTLIKNALVNTYSEDELSGSENDVKENKIPTTSSLGSKSKLANSTDSKTQSPDKSCTELNTDNITAQSATSTTNTCGELESPDPLPKKLQNTINCRLKNDLVVSLMLSLIVLGLHCSTVFTVLQPDLNTVLYSIVGVLGFILHYILPQMRKHMPWLCFSRPLLKQNEYGQFEVKNEAKIMWFEKLSVYLAFFERNILFPLVFISALTADSQTIVNKYGLTWGSAVVAVCSLKGVRSAYSDPSNQFLILLFAVLLFKFDFNLASETFLINYFFVSLAFRKCCDFLLKLQFIVTYIAPWQITWGSAFHAFAQPFSVPHSAMLFFQAVISSILSTPLNPFLGSAIFITSYVRPIKFWERDYNTRRIDHSNTRLSSQLERDLGADHNNLNSIFYEHLTRSLQHSLCGDLLLGRWGNVNQGDCFVLASDYINCLVHIIELGNGLCTFQMRGLEFRGTYCQQREVEAISEEVENNEGCCCCSPGHLPKMLSANAMFSTRWLAWQVVAAKYVVEGYSISENLATATLQLFDFRKVLITYYMKSIIYYVTINPKFEKWIASPSIQEALATTLHRQFVDLDPIFNYNLDEDFDCRALGITRSSYCGIYLSWIQFCYAKQNSDKSCETDASKNCDNLNKTAEKVSTKILENVDETTATCDETIPKDVPTPPPPPPPPLPPLPLPIPISVTSTKINETPGARIKTEKYPKSHSRSSSTSSRLKMDSQNSTKEELINNNNFNNIGQNSSIARDSLLVSLCLSLGLLARRSLATASHSSLSGVEFFLHGLHALFKGDFRITSPRDEWVFADMELLHGVVAPAVKMALKLHQDHFSSPDEFLDQSVLYEAITSNSKELVISHEADPVWRSAVLRGAPNLLALRHVLEDGSDEYRIIRLTKRFLDFRVIKLNRECVRGLWSGQQQELIYLRNRNPERGSIQNAKQALRNIINSSCDQPIGYPIYVSPLTTSYADTNKQLSGIIGGAITLEAIKSLVLDCWQRIRNRCRQGCSSGSAGTADAPVELPSVYFSPAPAPNSSIGGTTITYGSQNLSCSGTRGSLANINKPTSSTLLAGLLNRERDQEREIIREGRANRKSNASSSLRSDRERRATLPTTTSVVTGCPRDNILKDSAGSVNSGLRQLDFAEGGSPIISVSSSNLGPNTTTTTTATIKLNRHGSENMRKLELQQSSSSSSSPAITNINRPIMDISMPQPSINMHRKVIIVDRMEIYDCLDLGRRIDVIWPKEIMRANGGRLSWNDWSPLEGMVGYVVHYWQPNHSDKRYRSHVNQTLYLLEIGNHYVPVGENGIKAYNQIVNPSNSNATNNALKENSQRSLNKSYVETQKPPIDCQPPDNLTDIPLDEINTDSSNNSSNNENIGET